MMRKREVILYIAISLDGFIAREDGAVDWLDQFNNSGTDYGYADFYSSVDVILIGRKTYEQVLGFGEWPYPGKTCLVFSRMGVPEDANIAVESGSPAACVERLRSTPGRDIWLVGGGALIEAFEREDLVDSYVISIMPVMLGTGIRLFDGTMPDKRLRLDRVETFGDVVQLTYGRNGTDPA